MKRFKLFAAAALIGLGCVVGCKKANAAVPYEVTVGTVVPNGSTNGAAAFTAAGYPNRTGALKLRKITVSNYGDTSVAVVHVWKSCASSTTATSVFTGVAGASSTLNIDVLTNQSAITSPCISKETTAAGTVKATYWYE